AEGAATHTFALLFDAARASRLVEHHHRDTGLPSLHEVLQAALDATWRAPGEAGLAAAVKMRVEHVMLRHLMALGAREESPAPVQAIVADVLADLRNFLEETTPADPVLRAHRRAALAAVAAFERDPARFRTPGTLPPPPGMPI
ncbi:MAG: hypothetical protein NT133_15335, partial [Alphaproteobacteria bacterium]|nr:hypothetical protein [Alphaproteobacteria bacterium]